MRAPPHAVPRAIKKSRSGALGFSLTKSIGAEEGNTRRKKKATVNLPSNKRIDGKQVVEDLADVIGVYEIVGEQKKNSMRGLRVVCQSIDPDARSAFSG